MGSSICLTGFRSSSTLMVFSLVGEMFEEELETTDFFLGCIL